MRRIFKSCRTPSTVAIPCHMGLIDILSGLFPQDPTREWPPHLPHPSILDLQSRTFNGHPFGASLEEFKSLGRATKIKRWNKDRMTLFYAPSGFELLFDKTTGFDSVRCHVAAGLYPPNLPGLAFTTVRLTHSGGPAVITAATTVAEIIQWLGEPPVREEIDEEVVFEYDFGTLAVDVTTGAAGTVIDIGALLR